MSTITTTETTTGTNTTTSTRRKAGTAITRTPAVCVAWSTRRWDPHSHDAADAVDSALAASAEGIRTLKISFAGLMVTAAAQFAVVLLSGSVALLADTVHNFGDALTAVPVGIALVVGRRPVNRRYTYGYGRAEDLAGLSVLAVMTASAIFAAYEAVVRFVHPQPVHDLGWMAAAGSIGLAGNEFAAVYRIRTGRRIGSAALVTDGLHARADGLTSLVVVIGAAGTAAGWAYADPAAGLVISASIVAVLRLAAREVYGRLMDRVDERTLALAERTIQGTPGVTGLGRVRMRWSGHHLLAEAEITADPALRLGEAHKVAETVRHELLHNVRRLADATIHVDPGAAPAPNQGHVDAPDAHDITAHHFVQTGPLAAGCQDAPAKFRHIVTFARRPSGGPRHQHNRGTDLSRHEAGWQP